MQTKYKSYSELNDSEKVVKKLIKSTDAYTDNLERL